MRESFMIAYKSADQLAKIIKDKDINFQNIKNNIHYVNEPKDYIPRKGINIAIGSRETFVHNLKNLILKKS